MATFINELGNVYGQWTVLDYKGNGKWLCRCSCGKIHIVVGATLRNGSSTQCRSCATSNKNRTLKIGNKNCVTHGKSKTRLYRIWCGMHSRCTNPNDTGAKWYHDKGISVCDEWNDYIAFEKWALMHGYEEHLTIDRIDFNKCYSPENCRWVSKEYQANNTSRNKFITFNGETLSLTQWCRRYGVNPKTVKRRLSVGVQLPEAFSKHRLRKRVI